jgi:hypothetical protein
VGLVEQVLDVLLDILLPKARKPTDLIESIKAFMLIPELLETINKILEEDLSNLLGSRPNNKILKDELFKRAQLQLVPHRLIIKQYLINSEGRNETCRYFLIKCKWGYYIAQESYVFQGELRWGDFA